ncbi:MAG: lysophospholipid acyltransferase family protein [Bacteroidia bacterium]|nr:lysophospholipid acyltransferase family protein [Bacteroidia bacterium]
MSELISKKDIAKVLKLEKLKLKILAPAIMKLLRLGKLNDAYSNAEGKTGFEFTDSLLKEFGVAYNVSADDLQNIPKTGPFILLANHPYGGIDAMILLSVLSKIRPDIKFVGNFLLKQIPQLKDHIIAVNPFEDIGNKGMNIVGVKQILIHLQTSPLGIFPAGEVSALKLNNLKITDKKWEPAVGRIIAKAGVKVVPVYFSGNNSIAFNLLGLLHPGLRTIKLPSEMLNKQHSGIRVRIGKAIAFKELEDFKGERLLNFLRAKTYALGATHIKAHPFRLKLKRLNQPATIINAVNADVLENEILLLHNSANLFTYINFTVHIAAAGDIPNVLKEISRLREITFREVGEGTNRSKDSDAFDLYYKHLFIWDQEAKKIAGAYRIGEGDLLFKRFGVDGFYLSQLFKMNKEMYPILFHSIELGRSFVTAAYQRKPATLMLLWKGINEFLKMNDGRFQYMIGPVSISNSFSALSKDLLVAYIRHNYWDKKISKWIKPKKKFHYKSNKEGRNILLKQHSEDLKRLDSFIGEIEGNQKLKMPVLVKKYLKLNGKIVSFNVDPHFNDALDGFLIIEIKDIPNEAFDMVSR